jgi:hypothetical protein
LSDISVMYVRFRNTQNIMYVVIIVSVHTTLQSSAEYMLEGRKKSMYS